MFKWLTDGWHNFTKWVVGEAKIIGPVILADFEAAAQAAAPFVEQAVVAQIEQKIPGLQKLDAASKQVQTKTWEAAGIKIGATFANKLVQDFVFGLMVHQGAPMTAPPGATPEQIAAVDNAALLPAAPQAGT